MHPKKNENKGEVKRVIKRSPNTDENIDAAYEEATHDLEDDPDLVTNDPDLDEEEAYRRADDKNDII